MKLLPRIILFLFFLHLIGSAYAQSTYPYTAYASNGDTLYMTNAANTSFDFTITGEGVTWDYSSMTGVSQQRLVFRDPKQTGFTTAQWPYIQNTGNVNLSSTNGQSIAIGSIQTDNPNDYFKITSTVLQQSASSYNVYINDTKISIKNTYSSPDVLYHFPIAYNNIDSCIAQYATNIPNLYYNSSVIHRKNVVDGWGTVVTPYGTFSNALRIVSTVSEKDSIVVYGTSVPVIYNDYREIKWLDASKKQPVMIVKQTKVNGQYVTSTVSYLDQQQYYTPIALFAFYPLVPSPGDTVRFQNLSTNSMSFNWAFDDGGSGSNNASAEINPSHIFSAPGTYNVKLYSYNGPLVDSVTIPVTVSTVTATDAADENSNVIVFPNPCDQLLYVADSRYVKALVTDLSGNQLLDTVINADNIDLSVLEKGCYILHLSEENGKQTITTFLKQ